jgi:hypothetical protein
MITRCAELKTTAAGPALLLPLGFRPPDLRLVFGDVVVAAMAFPGGGGSAALQPDPDAFPVGVWPPIWRHPRMRVGPDP